MSGWIYYSYEFRLCCAAATFIVQCSAVHADGTYECITDIIFACMMKNGLWHVYI